MFGIGFILVHEHKDSLNHLRFIWCDSTALFYHFWSRFRQIRPPFFPLDTPRAAPSGVQVINLFGACGLVRDPAAWSVRLPLHAPPPHAFHWDCTGVPES